MKLSSIEQLLAQAEQLASSLREEAAKARNNADPLAVHIYHARKDYRQTALNDRKSGRRTEQCFRDTYLRAQELGYRGGAREWQTILSSK